jgi:hypothetical protein
MTVWDLPSIDKNLTMWLELEALKRGTANQRERWDHQLLPEEELTALARNELFECFTMKRWKNMSIAEAHDAIRHAEECHGIAPITFETEVTFDALTHTQWESWKVVQSAVNQTSKTHPWCVQANVTLTIVCKMHVATCNHCKKQVRFATALVVAQWAGRKLTREFAL